MFQVWPFWPPDSADSGEASAKCSLWLLHKLSLFDERGTHQLSLRQARLTEGICPWIFALGLHFEDHNHMFFMMLRSGEIGEFGWMSELFLKDPNWQPWPLLKWWIKTSVVARVNSSPLPSSKGWLGLPALGSGVNGVYANSPTESSWFLNANTLRPQTSSNPHQHFNKMFNGLWGIGQNVDAMWTQCGQKVDRMWTECVAFVCWRRSRRRRPRHGSH